MGDTSPDAARVRLDALRRMSGDERVKITVGMTNFMRKMTISRIRTEHPEWTDREIKRELLRIAFLPKPLPHDLHIP